MPAQVDLERLYDDHASALFAFLLNLTRSEADTRDLLQDLFVKIARQPELLNGIREERAFLFRLVHNAAIDLARRRETRQKYHKSAGAESDCVFVTFSRDEAVFATALSEALAELPIEQRAVVHLKLWEGLTFDSIAETLNISINTAASRYRYALDKLRARLRPLYDEIK